MVCFDSMFIRNIKLYAILNAQHLEAVDNLSILKKIKYALIKIRILQIVKSIYFNYINYLQLPQLYQTIRFWVMANNKWIQKHITAKWHNSLK